MTQTHTFQAETQQLLDILIHSLYTEREIFLRELISNASDALNRVQFEQLTNANVLDAGAELAIELHVDEAAGTLTVVDTGIGMTEEEIIANLGTIARSGAKQFLQALKDAPPNETATNIIGQFGVGFYSVFMVADKVRVVSRSYRPDAQAVAWESSGGTTYTVAPADKTTRGTEIIITLKEDAKEFLQAWRLREIVKKHSDFIAFPIYLGDDSETPINQQTAIWRKSPKEVSKEEYTQFYRMLTMDFNEPTHVIHMRADVPMQFYAVLYIPASSQQTLFSLRKEPGLQLYARKVLIDDYNKQLLPEYLQFVQGVVDSEDLPLNVSRESVKADRMMANLKNSLTKKVISELKRLAENERETYLKVHDAWARYLKQGVVVAPQDKDDLQDLLFFNSSHDDSPTSWHNLADYVRRMVEGQSEIYYVVADDFTSASRSPHLDAFRARGIEVLYFCDPVDALLPMQLTEYKGHKLRAVDDAELDLKDVGKLDETAAPAQEAVASDAMDALIARFKTVLGERVAGVQVSKTLVGSVARLVSKEGANGSNARRHMFRINRLLDKDYELPIKTLELNPHHALIHNLAHKLAQSPDDTLLDSIIEQVFETALLQEGIHPDPASMAERLTRIMTAATST